MKKRYECEHERNNVTPKAFYNYCKKQLAKKGIDIKEWIDFDAWRTPIGQSYFETRHDNGQIEKVIFFPYELQIYLQDSYNFILEFQFDTETTGYGYLYLTEYETETETENQGTTETVETVEETETLENVAADPVENINYRPVEKKYNVIHVDRNGRETVIRKHVSLYEANEAFYGIDNTYIEEVEV